MSTIELKEGGVRLLLAELGGAVLRFEVDGTPIFRPASDATAPFPFANFALVPYSNRISGGGFSFAGQRYAIAPNSNDFSLPIHGWGWLGDWTVSTRGKGSATLTSVCARSDWPSPFVAKQHFTLRPDGYDHILEVTNAGARAMPVGLGLHPYFPAGATALLTDFDGEWETAGDGLPTGWRPLSRQPDWFGGEAFDRGFTGRRAPMMLCWPDRQVTIDADPVFAETHVYIPPDRDHFCVEPVTHRTDAINSAEGMTTLGASEQLTGRVRFTVAAR